MTINEIEARTGLDRGTVRYYESEGLLRPARNSNGYRNYSEADLEKLMKVKLLRVLNFSVDDIRAMDADPSDFPDRLRARIRSLEAREENIGDLKRVLSLMLSDGASYESLDPGLYLRSIEERPQTLPAPNSPDAAPALTEPGTIPGPWRRYLARVLDYSLVELVYILVETIVFHIPITLSFWKNLLESVAVMLTALLLEPMLLSFFGTTPGKALLGIRVTDLNGERLTPRVAFARTWGVLLWGEGLFVPIWTWICLFNNYRDARNGVRMLWERESQLTLYDRRLWRNFAYAACFAALITVAARAANVPLMPLNRGSLTPEELAENVNRYFYISGEDPNYRLEADGAWAGPGIPEGIVIDRDFFRPSKVEMTVENGVVTGLRWYQRLAVSGETGCYERMARFVTALTWALAGADEELDLSDLRNLEKDTDLGFFSSFTVDDGNWLITCVTDPGEDAYVHPGMIRFPSGTEEYGVELTITRAE